mgnify:FL=1
MKIRLFIILLLFSLFNIEAKDRVTSNNAFKPGEVMKLKAYYHFGLLWFEVGEATFSVSEENGNYKFTVKAKNHPRWDWLYKLNTLHEASCTKSMEPIYMRSTTEDNGVFSTDEMHYKDGVITKYEKGSKYPDGWDTTYTRQTDSYDIINSVYVARNVDLSINGGKDIPFYPIFGNDVFLVHGSVIEKERIKTHNKVSYDCIKCTATVGAGTIFTPDEPVYVWVTDDNRKIPVLVEAKLRIGTVKVYLDEYVESD